MVQLALESVESVISASVNVEKEMAIAQVKKGEVSTRQLIEALNEFGYVGSLYQEPQAVESSDESIATWGGVKDATSGRALTK